ncbi:hypothetical protein BJX99DRAFT_231875 [Aspergillus californicus]
MRSLSMAFAMRRHPRRNRSTSCRTLPPVLNPKLRIPSHRYSVRGSALQTATSTTFVWFEGCVVYSFVPAIIYRISYPAERKEQSVRVLNVSYLRSCSKNAACPWAILLHAGIS